MVEAKRKQYKTTFGPGLKDVLEKQKDRVKEVTMDCIRASDYEAGEIIAKKIKDNNLI